VDLLDTGSTFHMFTNRSLLQDIKTQRHGMTYKTNAGHRRINKQGSHRSLIDVWLDDDASTNIVSYSKLVDQGFRIISDSAQGDAFFVFPPKGGDCIVFSRYPEGLYFHDPVCTIPTEMQQVYNGMIESVEKNRIGFTDREFLKAKEARNLQHTTGVPTIVELKKMIRIMESRTVLLLTRTLT